jgi:hypothetical protein
MARRKWLEAAIHSQIPAAVRTAPVPSIARFVLKKVVRLAVNWDRARQIANVVRSITCPKSASPRF